MNIVISINISIVILYTFITRSEKFKEHKLSPFKLVVNTLNPYIRGYCTAAGLATVDDLTLLNT